MRAALYLDKDYHGLANQWVIMGQGHLSGGSAAGTFYYSYGETTGYSRTIKALDWTKQSTAILIPNHGVTANKTIRVIGKSDSKL